MTKQIRIVEKDNACSAVRIASQSTMSASRMISPMLTPACSAMDSHRGRALPSPLMLRSGRTAGASAGATPRLQRAQDEMAFVGRGDDPVADLVDGAMAADAPAGLG